ncbi:MAG TPA: hypothetical protein VK805_02530 [Candidatus Baltobacteraceae bacterium]|nr:hypothetical protein [Candidatus Baltobacteraceae bacterium]
MRESSNSTVTYGTQRNGEARLAGKMAVRPTAGWMKASSKQAKSGPGEPGPYKGNSLRNQKEKAV